MEGNKAVAAALWSNRVIEKRSILALGVAALQPGWLFSHFYSASYFTHPSLLCYVKIFSLTLHEEEEEGRICKNGWWELKLGCWSDAVSFDI